MKIAAIFCMVMKATRISNFNPVMQIISVYKILLPEPNYQLKKTEKSTTGFSSQNFYSDNTLASRSQKLSIFLRA